MPDCLFCQIAAGTIPSYTVYEDDQVRAFLDLHPIRPGHILVVPKKHSATFYEADAATYQHIMQVVQQLAQRLDTLLKPKKVGLLIAGWDIAHTHVHIVPMEETTDLTSKTILEGTRTNPSEAELTAIQEKLT